MQNNSESFEQYLLAHNIPYPPRQLIEGKFIRWGKNGRYWAKKTGDFILFGDYVSGLSTFYNPDSKERLPYNEYLKQQQAIQEQKLLHEKQRQEQWEAAALTAQAIWNKSKPASATHSYLVNKNVHAYGIRCNQKELLIPLYDMSGKIRSLQFIDESGNKRFLAGGKTKGHFHVIGNLDFASTIYVTEGYATGATIHALTAAPVIITLNAGNIDPVIAAFISGFRDRVVVIAADNDHENKVNTGIEKAHAAARKYGCFVTAPSFNEHPQNGGLHHA